MCVFRRRLSRDWIQCNRQVQVEISWYNLSFTAVDRAAAIFSAEDLQHFTAKLKDLSFVGKCVSPCWTQHQSRSSSPICCWSGHLSRPTNSTSQLQPSHLIITMSLTVTLLLVKSFIMSSVLSTLRSRWFVLAPPLTCPTAWLHKFPSQDFWLRAGYTEWGRLNEL